VAPKPVENSWFIFFCKIHHGLHLWLQSDFKRGFSRWFMPAPKVTLCPVLAWERLSVHTHTLHTFFD
jgi:hypothetical protein